MGRARSSLLLTGVLAAASVLTVLASASETAHTGARPVLYTAVEAVIAVVALLAAFLAALRVQATRRLDDLLLACALGTLAVSHLVFTTMPPALESESHTWLWASASGRLVGAALLSVAAVAPAAPLAGSRALAVAAPTFSVAALVTIGLGFALADPSASTVVTQGELAGRMSVDVIHFVTLVLFAGAAVGYARRWLRRHSALAGWVAAAAGLAAVNRFDYLVDPSGGLSAVRVGDALRVLVYVLVVLALVRDAAERTAEEATRLERRRIARDLHDGLAQELAFIARRARTADGDGELAAAAERALSHSREAIAALRRPEAQSLEVALAAALDGLAARAGARLELDLAPVESLSAEEREALVAIAREAVANAARHAGAGVVRVELTGSDGVRLRIVDDGVGFDPGERRRRTFGLDGMRERAEAVGAAFQITSRPGDGTEVEVVLP